MYRSFNKSQQKFKDFINENDDIMGGEVDISQLVSDLVPVKTSKQTKTDEMVSDKI